MNRVSDPTPPDLAWWAVASCVFFALGVSPRFLAFRDGDLPVHIRYGREIVDRGRIPAMDPTLYPPTPFVDHEWLSDVLTAMVFGVGGLSAIVFLSVFAWAACVGLAVHLMARSRAPALLQAITAVLLIGTSWSHLATRPHLITWLGTLGFLLWRDRAWKPRGEVGFKGLVGLVGLSALWVNLHGGVLLIPPLLVGYGLVDAATRQPVDMRRIWRIGVAPAAAVVVGLFVNPWGPAWFGHMVTFLRSDVVRHTMDFQAPEPLTSVPGLAMLHLSVWLVLVLRLARAAPLWWMWMGLVAAWGWSSSRQVSMAGWVLTPALGALAGQSVTTGRLRGIAAVAWMDERLRDAEAWGRRAAGVGLAILVLSLVRSPVRVEVSDAPLDAIRSIDVSSDRATFTEDAGWFVLLRPDVPAYFHSLTANYVDRDDRLQVYLAVVRGSPGWQTAARDAGIRWLVLRENGPAAQQASDLAVHVGSGKVLLDLGEASEAESPPSGGG